MSETSPKLALPFLAPAQAQKHITVNEAFQQLDILVQLVVEEFDAVTPPAAPGDGQVWALGTGSTGDWAGQDEALAARINGAWRFIAPRLGWRAFGRADSTLRTHNGSAWQEVQTTVSELQDLTYLGVNTTADTVRRLSVSSQASLFTHDGAGHQMVLNKAGSADTGSVLFQTGFSGRAEIGLAGDDALSAKVSPDGITWLTALRVDPTTGHIGLGPLGDTTQVLSVSDNTHEPTIQIRNAGGAGGTAFRLIDDNSGGDWKFKTTSDGSFKLRDQSGGVDYIFLQKTTQCAEFTGAVRVGNNTVATLPDPAALGVGAILYVSDETGGPVLAFSDGTNWRRSTDRAVVS